METNTFDTMTGDDRWLGFGYLGERRNALDSTDPESPANPEAVMLTDNYVLYSTADWTAEELFAWANSKDGRWFADMTIGSATGHYVTTKFAEASRYLRKQGR